MRQTQGLRWKRSSEFVTGPQFEIVDIAARRGFAKELTRIKDSIVCLKIGVAVDLPSHFSTWPVPDETALARVAGDLQEAGNRINTVVQVLAPLGDEVHRHRNAAR